MANLTSISPNFIALAEYTNELTNYMFFPIMLAVVVVLVYLRFQTLPMEHTSVIATFVGGLLSATLLSVELIPSWIFVVFVALHMAAMAWAIMSKQS